jgi:hypothetical protein
VRLAQFKIKSSWYVLANVVYRGLQPATAPRSPSSRRAYRCGACSGPGHNVKSCRAHLATAR